MLGDRPLSTILGSALQPRHYRALANMVLTYPQFVSNFRRYITGRGAYPYRCAVRTPTGRYEVELFSHYDMLTLNEIFCRRDYETGARDRIVVDIGSNIGLSALYFLTRHKDVRCYLFEPDPKNVARMKNNLAGFENRVTINEVAVSNEEGQVKFGLDLISGRYGGIGVETGHYTQVSCRHINSVLADIFRTEERIDILKIDTEGAELKTVKAILPEYLKRIGKIYLECTPVADIWPDEFSQDQRGSVRRLFNRQRPS